MAKLDYTKAVALLDGMRTVAICGHVNPDGDCIGSVLALTLALRSRGFDATPLLATQERPLLYDFLPGYQLLTPAKDYRVLPDVFIALDTPTAERLGDGAAVLGRSRSSVAIDHHDSRLNLCNVNYGDPHSAAVGMMVWDFIDYLSISHTADIATCCYTAVVTDTGRFQFQNTDAAALRAAAAMANAGANPSEICRNIYQRRSMAALKLESLVIQRARFLCGGRAVVSWIDQEDADELGANKDDMESLIDVIRQLDRVEVAVMLKGQGSTTRGSIRSKTNCDVSTIAKQLGGGGHAAAAGFTVQGDLRTAVKTVVPLLTERLDPTGQSSRGMSRSSDHRRNL